MADGLDALDARRNRSNRTIPPSRHGARRTPVVTTEPAQETSAESAPDKDAPAVPASTPPTPIRAAKAASAEVEALVRTTIHLGAAEDSFLEEVRYAGRQSRPKIDASRSAVARLAIARLSKELTPDEIVAELRAQSVKSGQQGGRPRR